MSGIRNHHVEPASRGRQVVGCIETVQYNDDVFVLVAGADARAVADAAVFFVVLVVTEEAAAVAVASFFRGGGGDGCVVVVVVDGIVGDDGRCVSITSGGVTVCRRGIVVGPLWGVCG